MGLPIVLLGAGIRYVGGKAVQWGAKKVTKEAMKKTATKQAGVGATGLGVTNSRPAQAPGAAPKTETAPKPATAPKESSSISPEANKPESPATSTPNFASSFGP